MTNPNVGSIFDQLDRDRHLAGYRLEERASPYFREFLPDVMACYVTAVNPCIIPEFPLKVESNNRSRKVDFFALSSDCKQPFFIELKTDLESLRSEQFSYLKGAKKDLVSLVSEVLQLTKNKNTRHRSKYVHILYSLSLLGLVSVPGEVCMKAFPKGRPGLSEALCKVKTGSAGINKPKIVLILPDDRVNEVEEFADHIITFEKFANVVEKCGSLGKRFAKSLRCWAKHPAGSVLPSIKCA